MKRFMFSTLVVAVFFLGVGALVERTGASFRSDEKALELVRKARVALGGDSALAGVQSLRIVGQTTRSVKIEGLEKQHQGETEIAMQLPDKFMKMVKIGKDDGSGEGKAKVDRQVSVVVMGKEGEGRKIAIEDDGTPEKTVRKILIKKPDGTTEELTGAEADKLIVRDAGSDKAVWTENGKAGEEKHVIMRTAGAHGAMRQNEMLRFTLGLLLTTPQGMDVTYKFGGEANVEGTACNIVIAEAAGSAFKIYLGQTSNLPVMMVYTGHQVPRVFTFTKEAPAGAEAPKETMIFRSADGPGPETAEFMVKFSDYRSVGGVQFPYKWVQTVGGSPDETFDVTSYEVNPANIMEKFQNQKMMVRTAKPAQTQ